MKYLKLFESFEDIDKICKNFGIESYTINPDGSIDVDNNVDLYKIGLKEIPLEFNKVNGNFSCSFSELLSLEGCPKEVNGYFKCNSNKLTSLKFAPKIVRGNFWCQNNKINSFEHFPTFIKGLFLCQNNPIFEVWWLFLDMSKIELLNDFDIFRDEDTKTPSIILDRLNDFLLTIGKIKKKGFSYNKATEVLKNYKII